LNVVRSQNGKQENLKLYQKIDIPQKFDCTRIISKEELKEIASLLNCLDKLVRIAKN
jgi:hypothetical protein